MNVNVGSLIRRERQRQGLSLRELARRVGVSASMLSQVETDRTRPSVSTIYAIATELGISIDGLLSDGDRDATWRRRRRDRRRHGRLAPRSGQRARPR